MAAETVIVGCKAPNGLILNLDAYKVIDERSLAVQKMAGKATITLLGFARRFNEPDITAPTGGYRMNSVPADLWEQWFATHRDSSLLKDGIILPPPSAGAGQAASGQAQARERAAVPQMNPPLNPDGDPRAGHVKPLKVGDG